MFQIIKVHVAFYVSCICIMLNLIIVIDKPLFHYNNYIRLSPAGAKCLCGGCKKLLCTTPLSGYISIALFIYALYVVYMMKVELMR